MLVLITGGAGYIGSTVASACEDAGHQVVILDDFSPGRREFVGDRVLYDGDIADDALLDRIFAEIAARPVPDVLVIGHTDRTGSDPVNDALARQRADTVRNELLKRGLAPANVQASGRGSREPLVPTAAGVAEPRNRRVEIIVR